MWQIIIPKNHQNNDITFYKKYIEKNTSKYIISSNNVNCVTDEILLKNIKENSLLIIRKFLYFIYRFIQSDYYYPELTIDENWIPSNGFEFYNKKSSRQLGIYHFHLSEIDNSVIVYYFTYNSDGIKVIFEYYTHPNDDYKQILYDIYNRNDDGFNFGEEKYFKDIKNILQENMIIRFKDFIKEDFKQQLYTVGDIVKLSNGLSAKIKKINTKNSYIVNMMSGTAFDPTPIEVRDEDSGGVYITNIIQDISAPSKGATTLTDPYSNISNDFVINCGVEYIYIDVINENSDDRVYGKDGLLKSHSISKEMKEKILPYVNKNSYYINKKIFGLTIPKIVGKHFKGVGFGADKDGFFVNTHRARSKSYDSPENIPQKDINFIETTG